MTRTTLFLIATFHAVGSTTSAMEGPPPILNLTTYASVSGEYTLSVNPTDLHGRGHADYRFAEQREGLWTNRLPFTLWEAGIANSGHIGGYAYSHGWRGFSEEGYIDIDSVSQEWYFQPTNKLCWVVGYNDVFLVRDLRHVVRRIGRRSDGRWLEYPDKAAVARDGSLALLARSQSGEMSVNTYDAAGNGRSTFQVSSAPYVAALAYDGQHVCVRQKNDVSVYRGNGHLLGTCDLESDGAAKNWAGPFLAAEGSELWFISTGDMTVHRHAVQSIPGHPGQVRSR